MWQARAYGGVAVGHAEQVTILMGPAGQPVRSAYRRQVEQIPPPRLLDRDAELAELAEFCVGDHRGPYVWWQAGPWAGKSALMSTFVLNPPEQLSGRVWLVSFFITARLAAQDTRDAFTTVMTEQLCALLGQELPVGVSEATREAVLRDLLAQAATACHEQGGRLVLVVDGLDEDRGVTTGPDARSIAGLLPGHPPASMRIIVAGRPNPPVPDDVPDWHPLRDPAIVRRLTSSSHAHDVRRLGQIELTRLLTGSPLEQDLLGLLAAARGGLSGVDLRQLTRADLVTIENVLHTVVGRTFTRRASRWSPDTGPQTYLLGHEELHHTACHYVGPTRLAAYRDQLHGWADTYRTPGDGVPWPAHTPEYLLTGYPRMLESIGDLDRLTALATDSARHDRMLDLSGGDAAAFTEIRACQTLHLARTDPDLRALARLSFHRNQLESRNAAVPTDLPAAWAVLGHTLRAESLALSIADPWAQGRAARVLARLLARTGDWNRAEQLANAITNGAERAFALRDVLWVMAEAGDVDRAERIAHDISELDWQADALGYLFVVATEAGDLVRADRLAIEAEHAAHRITDPGSQAATLSRLVGVVSGAGDLDRAERIARGISGLTERVRELGDLVGDMAAAGDLVRAERLAIDVEDAACDVADPYERTAALGVLVRAMSKAGDVVGARRLAGAAEHAARSITHPHRRVRVLSDLTRVMAQAGDLDQARSIADEVEQATRAVTDYSFGQADVLWDLVKVMSDAGDLDRAERIAHGISEGNRRAQVLSELVQVTADAGDLERAERIAQGITDPSDHTRAMRALARVIAEAGDPNRAEEMAYGITDLYQRATALVDLVRVMAKRGELGQARRLAEDAERAAHAIAGEHPFNQVDVLRNLVRVMSEAGDLDRAERFAHAITDQPERAQALTGLVHIVARAGDLDRARRLAAEAEQAARGTTDSFVLGDLTDLTRAIAEAGDLDRAEQLAHGYPIDQVWAWIGLAGVAARAGDRDRVGRVAAEVELAVQRQTGPHRQETALTDLTRVLADAGDLDLAEQTARTLADSFTRANELKELLRLSARAGDLVRARRLAAAVEHIARHTAESFSLAVELVDLARAMSEAGDLDQARRLAADAEDTIRGFEHLYSQAGVLTDLARVFAESGDLNRARQLAAEAERTARDITAADERESALEQLVGLTAEAGDVDRAERIAHDISDLDLRARALGVLVQVTAAAGDLDLARRLAAEAEHTARGIADPQGQGEALTGVGEVTARFGDLGQARRLAADAERILRGIPHLSYRGADTWGDLVRLTAEAGDLDRAEQIARGATDSSSLSDVVRIAIEAGDLDRAEQIALRISDQDLRSRALARVAHAAAEAGDVDRAERVVRAITAPVERVNALIEVAELVGSPAATRLLGEAFALGSWSAPLSALARLAPRTVLLIADDVMAAVAAHGHAAV